MMLSFKRWVSTVYKFKFKNEKFLLTYVAVAVVLPKYLNRTASFQTIADEIEKKLSQYAKESNGELIEIKLKQTNFSKLILFQLVQLRQISTQSIIIQTVPNHKFVWNDKAGVINLHGENSCLGLVQKHGNF